MITIEKVKQYNNINEALYDYALNIKDNFKTDIYIYKDNNSNNIYNLSQVDIYKKAKINFSKIGKNHFENSGNLIYVTNEDIKESIAKTLRNFYQKQLLLEHIVIFSVLDKIIKQGTLLTVALETKFRLKYKKWFYYVTPIFINHKKYFVQFDAVLRNDDLMHFRLQRIYSFEEIKKQVVPTGLSIKK